MTTTRIDTEKLVAVVLIIAALLLVLKAGLDLQNAATALHTQPWWTR